MNITNQLDQQVGERIMAMLNDYNKDYSDISSLDELIDFSTGNFANNGGDNCMTGYFEYQSYSFSFYVTKPSGSYMDVCGPDQTYTGSDEYGYGNFTVESAHQERNVVVISCNSLDAWNVMGSYILGD